jgi:hypothetical protein
VVVLSGQDVPPVGPERHRSSAPTTDNLERLVFARIPSSGGAVNDVSVNSSVDSDVAGR